MLSLGFMQSATALFYSGIFWMMVLFIVENRRVPPSERKPLVPLALLLMVASAYLILGVVARQPAFVSSPFAAAVDGDASRK